MVMSYIWTGLILISIFSALISGKGSELASSVPNGAQAGINLVISLAGSVCLWTGVGKLMEETGVTGRLSKLLKPLLCRVFPTAKEDSQLRNALSANICANFLGLGNAATPMGIQAAIRLANRGAQGVAGAELCRLVVLNTASIQLIPATVSALRAGLGCKTPFDILPAVWITSVCSAGAGILCAWGLEKIWKK